MPRRRHICLAYARKAATQYPEESALRAFWGEKLGVAPEDLKELPEGRAMTDLIRAKTMKKEVLVMCNRFRFLSQDGRYESICPA